MPHSIARLTDVDLKTMPEADDQHDLNGDNTSVTVGDLHGNTLKLIWFLIRENVMQLQPMEPYTSAAQAYQRLVEIYQKPVDDLTPADIEDFNQIIAAAHFNEQATVRLVGDELADRGANDYFTLIVLSALNKSGVNTEILLSNHSAEFLDAYRQTNLQEVPPDNRLGPGQARSLYTLSKLIQNDLVTTDEIEDIVERVYKPSLRAISYSVNQEAEPPELTLFTHAPAGLETIEQAARQLKVPYKDDTIDELIKTIDSINDAFYAKRIINNNLFQTDKQHPDIVKVGESLGLKSINPEMPFLRLAWNRTNRTMATSERDQAPEIPVNIPPKHKGYGLNLVHGHTGPGASIDQDNVINLDNDLGKGGHRDSEFTGDYLALYTEAENSAPRREIEVLDDETLRKIEALNDQPPPVQLDNVFKTGRPDAPIYYMLDKDHPKGRGNFGVVLPAKRIDLAHRHFAPDKLVVKIFDQPQQHTEKEVIDEYKLQNPYIKTEFLTKLDDHYYLFMEDLGENLENWLQQNLNDLNMHQRAHLITSYLQTINLWAHHTPTTGMAIQNFDVKPDNMAVRVQVSSSGSLAYPLYEVNPLDYGLAEVIPENDPNNERAITTGKGTIFYSAPEILRSEKASVRSDIFSMVPFVARILGADDPVKKLQNQPPFAFVQMRMQHNEASKFSLDNLLVNLIPDEIEFKEKLTNVVTDFLNQMQAFNSEDRPSAQETVKFFHNFKNLIKAYDAQQMDIVADHLNQMKQVVEGYNDKASKAIVSYQKKNLGGVILRDKAKRSKHQSNYYLQSLSQAKSAVETNALLYALLRYTTDPKLKSEVSKGLGFDSVAEAIEAIEKSLIEDVGEENSEALTHIMIFVEALAQEANDFEHNQEAQEEFDYRDTLRQDVYTVPLDVQHDNELVHSGDDIDEPDLLQVD